MISNSSVLWTILALCAQLAAAVFTMTLTTERFTYRAIFNSVVLFAAHYFTFFTFIAIYFPRSNELVKILADSYAICRLVSLFVSLAELIFVFEGLARPCCGERILPRASTRTTSLALHFLSFSRRR